MAHAAAVLSELGVVWLAQAAGQVAAQVPALPDTIVTIQAPIQPGWFERLQETLRALMTLAILVLTVAVVPAAWNFRKSYQKVSDLLDRVYADVNPLTHHAARIAENVDYVSTAVRADSERARALLAQAEARLTAAMERAEARARDFEALVHVAQQEAERTLVTAASTAAGVREGVASLRDDLAAALQGGSPARHDLGTAPDVEPDDVALVEARPGLREASHAARPTASSVDTDDLTEGVTDAVYDVAAQRAPVQPRLRPRDRG